MSLPKKVRTFENLKFIFIYTFGKEDSREMINEFKNNKKYKNVCNKGKGLPIKLKKKKQRKIIKSHKIIYKEHNYW